MDRIELCYQDLIAAIVKRAIKDWECSTNKLKRNPRNVTHKRRVRECEEFFKSDYFYDITGLHGDYVLNMLKKNKKMKIIKNESK